MADAQTSGSSALSGESKQDWSTPQWLFEALDRRFAFELDAAASTENAKCRLFHTEKENGLVQAWWHTTFCNPPWRDPAPWCAKALASSIDDSVRSVLLLPQLGLTAQWWRNFQQYCRTEILTPRIAYDGGLSKSPSGGSMLLVFGDGGEGSIVHWDVSGWRK